MHNPSFSKPPEGSIFVFGSNLRGIHGAGAARDALDFYGAKMGVGEGLTGWSYALPTKDEQIETLPLERVAVYVENFKAYATDNSDLTFFVTKVGCGLAGFTEGQISPLFKGSPSNCILPEGWAA